MLRDRVSGITFARGKEYFEVGCVKGFRAQRNEARAEVEGSMGTYDVRLWDEDGGMGGTCDCPAYEDMGFCKHCVAVCFVLLDAREKGLLDRQDPRGKSNWVTMEEIEAFLKRVEREKLEGWVLSWTQEDLGFRDVLERETLKARKRDARKPKRTANR
jgi:uncharacterized Zn finger protein